MSLEHKDERSYSGRKPILVGSETPVKEPEQIEDEAEWSPADIAGANDEPEYEDRPAQIETQATPAGKQVSGTRDCGEEPSTPLFSARETNELRSRWDAIQVGFVDEPRHAVEEADGLVTATAKRLADIFADERKTLEHQWSRGDEVSTEDLRLALQRYRSFFGRLLSV